MNHGNDQNQTVLNVLRGHLKHLPYHASGGLNSDESLTLSDKLSDSDCLRFLHARKNNVDKSIDMIKHWATWRESNLPGSDRTPSNIDPFEDSKEDIYRKYLPHSNLGDDKVGHPIYWEKTGYISSQFSEIKKHLTEDDIIVRHVKQQELMSLRFKTNTLKYGKEITKAVGVFDMAHVSFAPDAMAFRAFRRMLAIDESCYPETLHRLYMINTPIFFSAIWAVIRPWLDHETAEKFHLVGTNFLPELLKEIDSSQIPKELGGEKEDFFWTYPENCLEKQH